MGDTVDIDLTGYKDRVGGRIPVGRYRVVVSDAEKDTSKQNNTMINLWLRVQGGDQDGSEITDRLVLTEKSLWRVVSFMEAIGLPTPRKRLRVNLDLFIGKVLDVDVDDGDPYMGKVKSEVRGYMAVQAGQSGQEAADLPDEPPSSPQGQQQDDPWDDLTRSTDEPEAAGEVDLDTLDLE